MVRAGKRRTNATKVLAQGTGKAVSQAFGSNGSKRVRIRPKKARIGKQLSLPASCWDAFSSAHAALPRSVGPYTVVRTTRMVTTSSLFSLIGTFREGSNAENWSNVTMVSTALGQGASSINAAGSSDLYVGSAPGGDTNPTPLTNFTCCPAAISVQIMGNSSLQSASGQYAAAVVPVRLDLYGDNRTWNTVCQEFIAFMRPRLLSGGKLALRGVQMDSMPLSMNDVSDFLPMRVTPADILGTSWTGGNQFFPRGWAPLCLFNEAEQPVTLLITTEWRVRFDLNNPAVASHTHHGVTSDKQWDSHIARASAALPGVCDIVEKVANTGLNIYKASQAAGLLA